MASPRCRLLAVAAVVIIVATLAASNSYSHAQVAGDSGGAAVPQEDNAVTYDEAFEEMLKDPGNLEKTFRFAKLAVKTGDLEGAISAYSRLLILMPENWRIRYELGVLYFRLKSYALAKSYFRSAEAAAAFPPALRPQTTRFVEEIDRQLSQHRISGMLVAGVRYQSNVNAAGSPTVQQASVSSALLDSFTEKDDFDLFGSLDVSHVYDFDTVDATAIKSGLQLYGAKQMSEDEFDLVFLEADSGPQFRFFQGEPAEVTTQPYLLVDYVHLGESRLYASFGAGLRFDKTFSEKISAGLSYDLRDRDFRNSSQRPNATNLDGINHKMELNLGYRFTPDLVGTFRARGTVENANAPFESNREIATLIGATVFFPAPFSLTEERWISRLTLEYARAAYDEPNPDIDASKSRIDQRWTIRYANIVPLAEAVSAIVGIGYRNNGSNIANFEYDNLDVFLALSLRF